MPSTTPDLRTVTGGRSSVRAAGGERSASLAPEASAKVDGARPGRRGGSASAALARSDFGQASSNVAGGASLDSGGGGAAARGGRSSARGGAGVWAPGGARG